MEVDGSSDDGKPVVAEVTEYSIASTSSTVIERKPGPKSRTKLGLVDQDDNNDVAEYYSLDDYGDEDYETIHGEVDDLCTSSDVGGNSHVRRKRGKPSDPVNDHYTKIGIWKSMDVVKCNYCPFERTRILRYMRYHLAEECKTVPIEVKDWQRKEVDKYHNNTEARLLLNSGYTPWKDSLSLSPNVVSSKEVKEEVPEEWSLAANRSRRNVKKFTNHYYVSSESDEESDDDFDKDPRSRRRGRPYKDKHKVVIDGKFLLKRALDGHEKGTEVKVKQSKVQEDLPRSPPRKYLSLEERERREHEARVKKYAAETNFFETQNKTWSRVGPVVCSFFQSLDSLVQEVRSRVCSTLSSGTMGITDLNQEVDVTTGTQIVMSDVVSNQQNSL